VRGLNENRGSASGHRRDLHIVISLKYYRFSQVRTNDLPAETTLRSGTVSERKCSCSDPDEMEFEQRPLTEALVDDPA
jgi:hypothetical protein